MVRDNDITFVAQLKARYERMLALLRRQRDQLDQKIALVEKHIDAAEYLLGSNLRTLEDLDTAPGEPPELRPGEQVEPPAGMKRRRGQGIADAAFEVLGGTPYLHARDIWKSLQQQGYRSNSKDPVKMLGTLLLQDDRFAKVAPQTFARAVPRKSVKPPVA